MNKKAIKSLVASLDVLRDMSNSYAKNICRYEHEDATEESFEYLLDEMIEDITNMRNRIETKSKKLINNEE